MAQCTVQYVILNMLLQGICKNIAKYKYMYENDIYKKTTKILLLLFLYLLFIWTVHYYMAVLLVKFFISWEWESSWAGKTPALVINLRQLRRDGLTLA
jgi:hypothetical protein